MLVEEESLRDLKQDLDELASLTSASFRRLSRFRTHLIRFPGHVRSGTRETLIHLADSVLHTHRSILEAVHRASGRSRTWTANELPDLIALKREQADILRSVQGIVGSLVSSADWQSPSFASSGVPQAGTQTGKIMGTLNDYKRDQHLDAERYERAFRRQYVRGWTHFPMNVHATSSGMSAFSTIVTYLQHAGKINGPVLAGENCYFENKGILMRAFGDQVHFVDEMDTIAILNATRRLRPGAIFLDSLCNNESVSAPDLKTLIPALARETALKATLVLDNSGMAIMYDPLRDLPHFSSSLKLIVIESLNKYHQFGFDRVTGGMIWSPGLVGVGLFGARMHLGTNIPDASVNALPEPNRSLLEKRMLRIGRNAQTLAEAIDAHVKRAAHGAISHVAYPGLPSHPSYAWTSGNPFHGGCFTLVFKPKYQRTWLYKRLLSLVLSEARKEGVPLVAGSSFGLDTTRVYLTALHATGITKPFLRISPGTECRAEMETLARVFTRAIDRLGLYTL